jgi:hypothetical protein
VEEIMNPVKKTLSAALAGLSLPVILSVTIAHADPIGNDTLKLMGVACAPVAGTDDGTTAAQTRCNFPAGFTVPIGGRVELLDPDGSISDIVWDHEDGSPDHFHFISDSAAFGPLTFIPGHRGDFFAGANPLAQLKEADFKGGDIDVSTYFGLAAGSLIVTSDATDSASEVPEPGTLLLLGTSLVAGARYWRRRPKA